MSDKFMTDNSQHVRIDKFEIEISLGARLSGIAGGSFGIIEAEFHNKEFHQCIIPFSEPYSRHEWRILAEINGRITEFEEGLEEGMYDE